MLSEHIKISSILIACSVSIALGLASAMAPSTTISEPLPARTPDNPLASPFKPASISDACPIIPAAFQTESMATSDDTADDPALWIHPTNPEQSIIITTNKKQGLVVYNLQGFLIQSLPIGKPNNVDVLCSIKTPSWSFPTTDLAMTGNRDGDIINLFTIDPSSGILHDAGSFSAGFQEVYGICAYFHPGTASPRIAINNKSGTVRIFELLPSHERSFTSALISEFHVGTQVEGMVADPAHNSLYIGEEQVGLWRYRLDPIEDQPQRTLVDLIHNPTSAISGRLARDVEGVTLYELNDREGYIIASCQSEDRFAIYDRISHAYRGSFRISTQVSSQAQVDAVTHTDGIAACSLPVGSRFPHGLFIAQDDNAGQPQNFKIVDWQLIAQGFTPPLRVRIGRNSTAPLP